MHELVCAHADVGDVACWGARNNGRLCVRVCVSTAIPRCRCETCRTTSCIAIGMCSNAPCAKSLSW